MSRNGLYVREGKSLEKYGTYQQGRREKFYTICYNPFLRVCYKGVFI